MSKYLDDTGLSHYDSKIKDFVKAMSNGSSFTIVNSGTYNANANTLSGWTLDSQEDGVYYKYNNSYSLSKANVEDYIQLMFGERRLPTISANAGRNLFFMASYSDSYFVEGCIYRLNIEPSGSSYTMKAIPVLTLLTAGAGVSPKYQHNIRIYGGSNGSCFSFSLITNSSTPLTYNTLPRALYAAGFNSSSNVLPANGFKPTSSSLRAIYGVYCSNSSSSGTTLYYRYVQLASLSSSTATIAGSLTESYDSVTLASTGWTVTDIVTKTIVQAGD